MGGRKSGEPCMRENKWKFGRPSEMLSLLVFGLAIMLGGCVSHEQHLRSDAEVCKALGHTVATSEYQICMKALNARRCEDRTSRDPMCQYAGAK
jgi:hypothetical protein